MTCFSLVIISYVNASFENNKLIILFLLVVCISTDVGGYIFGNLIGGKKLTKISPNKTYAGAIGSLVLSLILGYLFFINQINFTKTNFNVIVFIIIVSVLSQIGDLIISILKRKAKIKDTGTFLPGHGGILDRIDGMLLAIPLESSLFLYIMTKDLILLGSTGSIGTSTLKVIKKNKTDFKIKLLTTNKNIKKILKQAIEFNVKK